MNKVDRIKKEMQDRKDLKMVSPLEEWVYRWLKDAKLYHVKREYPVGNYLIDFAFVEEKIALEVDGWAFHSSEKQIDHDQAKDRYLEGEGWKVIRLPSASCWNPKYLCSELKKLFEMIYPSTNLPYAIMEVLDLQACPVYQGEKMFWCEACKKWEDLEGNAVEV